MKYIAVTNNSPPSPFTKGGIITPPFSKGRLGGIFLLTNPKGISVLFLVIAMMLMVTIGYVFSYLIPTKQKTSSFPIHSIKAFYLAQSGVEYAVRYAVAQGWLTPATLIQLNGAAVRLRYLGDRNGQFTVNYDRPTNTLTSIGVIPGGAERRIIFSNFTSFLRTPTGVILDPREPAPCWNSSNRAQFYIINGTENNVTFTRFEADWTGGNTYLTAIYMGGSQIYSGNSYESGDNREPFDTNPTILSNQKVLFEISWNGNTTERNIVIRFYYRSGGTWYYYRFYLDPAGTGLGSC